MGLFGRKKQDAPGGGAMADPATAAESAELPEGAEAESVDLSAAAAGGMAEETVAENHPAATNDKRAVYKQPEPVMADRHGALGVDLAKRTFDHARGAHLAPITLREFPQVALHYPIVFAGEKRNPYAVMGLRSGVNLFVEDDGSVTQGAYMPAYFQQYPFLLARSKEANRSILFLDRAASALVENGGEPLFENGEPSAFAKRAMAFLNGLQAHWRETEQMIAKLIELDLFETKELKLAQRAASGDVSDARSVVKYLAVDFEKMRTLPGAALQEFSEKNHLLAIYSHQISLFNWGKIVSRAFAKQSVKR